MNTHTDIASEYQSKFRFYFVALVFTLLAASIQTADLSHMRTSNQVLELIGWVLLLVSGLCSLSFLEFTPVVYRHFDAINNSSGEAKKEFQAQLKKIQDINSVQYATAKYSFVAGLALIIISRGAHGLFPAIVI